MGPKHSKDEILERAIDAVVADGLHQLTFGRLAKRIGTSDRIIVYYFPTKDDLVTEVLVSIGLKLQLELEEAFAEPAADHVELAANAWTVVARPDLDPIFALYFEAVGLAAAGREPYRTLVYQLLEGWIDWLAESFEGTGEHRRSEAEAALALIDGLLLMRTMAGPEAADRAAGRLGVLPGEPLPEPPGPPAPGADPHESVRPGTAT